MGDKKKSQDKSLQTWQNVPQQGLKLVLIMLFISVFLHLGSAITPSVLNGYFGDDPMQMEKSPPVKIKIIERTKQQEEDLRKILETPQEKTERPVDPKFMGNEDHKAKKQTKIAEENIQNKAGADAGQQGERTLKEKKKEKKKEKGQLHVNQRKPRNAYEKMLPIGTRDLEGQVKAGYQDYIDDKIAEGDRIDIDTAQYRYLGYFINMRKAISLVWNYPSEAVRKGLKGEVGLEFALSKDGSASRIKVIKTSGYDILDTAIVEAIKLASPFSPLPEGFGKERIVITGSFRYVLGRGSYGSH